MINFFCRLYKFTLNFYPKQFQADFRDEMQAVFEEMITDQKSQFQILELFLCEIRDLLVVLFIVVASNGFHGGVMNIKKETITPLKKRSAFIGVLPFMIFGLARSISITGNLSAVQGYNLEIGVYCLILVGFLVGWLRSFPLWSYSYLGWAIVLAWSNTNVRVAGIDWSHRFWIAFGATVLIALLWTRLQTPVKDLLGKIWMDWTRLTLIMYCLGAWIFLTFDENHHPYLLAFILAATIAVSSGAWFFLRSSKVSARIVSILGGFITAAIINGFCWATWDWYGYYGFPRPDEPWFEALWTSTIGIIFWLALLFWPAILNFIQHVSKGRKRLNT